MIKINWLVFIPILMINLFCAIQVMHIYIFYWIISGIITLILLIVQNKDNITLINTGVYGLISLLIGCIMLPYFVLDLIFGMHKDENTKIIN